MTTYSEQPVITTIIPTYRRPVLLRRAIASALGQSYPHVQVCVYDNASGDETESVVREIVQRDGRVKYHRHPNNIGSYNNFNYGIREVSTPFFSLLSDDDVLAPTFYAETMEAFKKYPDAMFVSMATIMINTELHVTHGPLKVPETRYYGPGEAVKGMVEGVIPCTWTGIVYRREVREAIGLIDTTVGPGADIGYVYHAAARFPGVVVPGVAAAFTAHEESASGTTGPLSGEWTTWWQTMMRTIHEDNQVPAAVRKYVSELPPPNYLRIGLMQASRALANGEYQYASKVAQGIRECGYHVIGTVVAILSRIASFPPINALIRSIRTVRRKWHLHRRNELHKELGHLVEFVQRYR